MLRHCVNSMLGVSVLLGVARLLTMSGPRPTDILIVGDANAGKTALFYLVGPLIHLTRPSPFPYRPFRL